MKARITISLKPGILDPQGKAIEGALHAMGYENAANVRQGKIIEMTVTETDANKAHATVEEMCKRLLANPVMENYAIEVEA